MAIKDNVVNVKRNNDEQEVVMEDEDFSDDWDWVFWCKSILLGPEIQVMNIW